MARHPDWIDIKALARRFTWWPKKTWLGTCVIKYPLSISDSPYHVFGTFWTFIHKEWPNINYLFGFAALKVWWVSYSILFCTQTIILQIWFALTSCVTGVVSFLLVFLLNIVVFLLLTIIIATITLIERKVLSLVQRRVGPNYVGYRGRLQFIADALKFLLKHIPVFSFTNRFLFLAIPALVLIFCYLFWLNLVWGPSLAICEVEYNLLFMGVLSVLFSILLFLTGWVSKNKYAILSSNRVIITSLNLEIFLNFILLFLLLTYESFSFLQIVNFQNYFLWGVFLYFPLLPLLLMVFLLETGRIPFDLGEAESELIAGYTTEMGGFFFALFYLGEYFHLFCFSVVYVLCFFGGWAAV